MTLSARRAVKGIPRLHGKEDEDGSPRPEEIEEENPARRGRASMSLKLGWTLHRWGRKIRRGVCGRLYSDRNQDPDLSLIVAGAGRSGTTWLADLIAPEIHARLLFEPFYPQLVPEYSEFEYFQYMRPSEDDQRLYDFTRLVLSGRLRNRWVDSQVDSIFPRRRIIKDIRMCLLLRWLHARFPAVPILFMIRHPCAVVASRVKLRWAADGDIAPFLRQEKLREDFLEPWIPTIENARTEEEKHAVVWCVSNAVPLLQFQDSRLSVVFYEDLANRSNSAIPRIFDVVGEEYSEAVFRHHSRPSPTATSSSSIVRGRSPTGDWRGELSQARISRILEVVARFGLDSLYSEDGTPRDELPAGVLRLV